jgi:hypothetical protein
LSAAIEFSATSRNKRLNRTIMRKTASACMKTNRFGASEKRRRQASRHQKTVSLVATFRSGIGHMYNIDDFDLKILTLLQANGRLTNQELSDLIGLSASQCSRVVSRWNRRN